ncbi:MAG: asparagine synthase C-terminal domain-containing protein, partial [Acidobacteriia bacterium]|nr:asparagine synthase C-terminal domain-containing protein [Terriglobia bacterium]
HVEVVRPDAMAVLNKLVEHCGEPFADSSILCTYYVAQIARQHVKMVLSGDGGDETFGGYDYFGKLVQQHPQPHGALGKLRRAVGNGARGVGVRAPLPQLPTTWYERNPYFSERERLRLWRPEYQPLLKLTREWNDRQFEGVKDSDVLSQCQSVDLHNYLPFDNLHKVDIASMCHGLEVRVPFLDHVFLEIVAEVPAEMKLKADEGWAIDDPQRPVSAVISKYILKRTAERFFNTEFLHRPKRGFSMPVPAWFAGPLYEELRDRLNDPAAAMNDFFDVKYIAALLEEHREKKNHGWGLWALLFLATWKTQNQHLVSV